MNKINTNAKKMWFQFNQWDQIKNVNEISAHFKNPKEISRYFNNIDHPYKRRFIV